MMHTDRALPDIATATSRSHWRANMLRWRAGAMYMVLTPPSGALQPIRPMGAHCRPALMMTGLRTSYGPGVRAQPSRGSCASSRRRPARVGMASRTHSPVGWHCGRGSCARSARPGRGAGSAATRAALARSRYCADPMAPVRHHGRSRTVIVPDVRLTIGARHHVAIHRRISHAAAVGPRATRSA